MIIARLTSHLGHTEGGVVEEEATIVVEVITEEELEEASGIKEVVELGPEEISVVMR